LGRGLRKEAQDGQGLTKAAVAHHPHLPQDPVEGHGCEPGSLQRVFPGLLATPAPDQGSW
jgi:hypothetical protein